MKKKTEKAYFNELWVIMNTHLLEFLKTSDQEKLHHFRVQVKKLGALLEMLDTASAKSKLAKIFKPVRGIFKHAGRIREAYINLQLSAHYELNNDEFILKQVNEMEREIIEFRNNEKKYLKIIKAVHSDLEDRLEAIKDEQINEFYKMRLEQITVALGENRFDDELHNCRKKIKALVYNRKLAAKALEGRTQIDSDYLDKLQGRIGDWHDTVMTMELFSEQQIVDKPVISKIRRQNTNLKKSINALAADFWKKATMAAETEDSGKQAHVWV